jgi:hypothetical protein
MEELSFVKEREKQKNEGSHEGCKQLKGNTLQLL